MWDRSLTGSSSTTSTMTLPITDCPTSSASAMPTIDENMRQIIAAASSPGRLLNDLMRPAASGSTDSPVISSVNTAPRPTRARTPALVGAPASADDSTEGTEPVYDIQVEDGHLHEFFANGVLVHNTSWVPGDGESPDRLDALVYALGGIFPATGVMNEIKMVDHRARR